MSVALPVCDNERFVAEAVQSILRQTCAPTELVIGDDGSQDGTPAILRTLAREHPAIRLLRREHKSGLANAANWVVANTRCDLVALAHADDLSHPDRLARQTDALLARQDAVMVGAPGIGIDEAGREVHPANLWRLVRPSVFAPFAHSSVMFRRRAFLAAGGYRSGANYWEDLDLFWRMARQGRLLVLPAAVSAYRYSGDSTRSRDGHVAVERAIQHMYDLAADATTGDAVDWLDRDPPPPPVKLRPRVFIARSWVDTWRARRPGTWLRLWRYGRLRFDVETALALTFIGGGTVAPRLFRVALKGMATARNALARRQLATGELIEWTPFPPPPRSSAERDGEPARS